MTRTFVGYAFAAAVILGLAGPVALEPSSAFAQQKQGKHEKAQSAKKPGESCESLPHNSKAYADCIKRKAQDTKSSRHPGGAPGKGKKPAQ